MEALYFGLFTALLFACATLGMFLLLSNAQLVVWKGLAEQEERRHKDCQKRLIEKQNECKALENGYVDAASKQSEFRWRMHAISKLANPLIAIPKDIHDWFDEQDEKDEQDSPVVRITQNEFGQWYVSRTDDDGLPRYLRSDGTWHRMMRDLGGTYFKTREEAEQMVKEWCQ